MDEFDGATVGDHVALETPLAPEDVRQEQAAALHRDAVVVVVGGHDAERAGVTHGATERLQEDGLHIAPRDLRVGAGLAVAPALRDAVDGEVLEGGNDALFLDAAHLLEAELAGEERVLRVSLGGAAPARIARQLEHGRIDVGVAEGAPLAAGDAADLAHEFAVEGGADAELRGKTGGPGVHEAADALVGEIGGDAETGLLDEEALHLVQGAGVQGIRQIVFRQRKGAAVDPGVAVHVLVNVADAVLPERRLPRLGRQLILEHAGKAVERHHLRGLFLKGHAREEVGDARLDIERRILVGILHAVLVQVDPAVVVDGRQRIFADEDAGGRRSSLQAQHDQTQTGQVDNRSGRHAVTVPHGRRACQLFSAPAMPVRLRLTEPPRPREGA